MESTNITLDSTIITYDGNYIIFDDNNWVGTKLTKRMSIVEWPYFFC
jgi:hypothetical protein